MQKTNEIRTPRGDTRRGATELLAPGGSFDQAVHALRAGADAVYCGAPRFSARSHARNLDFAQLRRLCGEAARRPAHIYLAINTVIRTAELADALDTAWHGWEAGVSALIVQDLGLLRALRRHGPPLPLHASTQLAVHSASGAAAALDLGFARVVLARELTVTEIATIIAAVPRLEYECFIHGALCYGVSGLCLASGLLLGRSGNRGDCGQVCRTWSTRAPGGSAVPDPGVPRAGYWFSMNDLEASGLVRDLAAAGVRSFKIEGRMKPPEWTRAVVRHYRQLLDDPASSPDHASLTEARTVFGRQPSSAFLRDGRGQSLVNHWHAGSTGVPIGPILEAKGNRVLVRSALPLAVKDGIQLVRPADPPVVLRLGITAIESAGAPGPAAGTAGPRRFSCAAGETVWLVSGEARFQPGDAGLELAKIADHASNLPAVKPESLPPYHRGLAVAAGLDAAAGLLKLSASLAAGASGGVSGPRVVPVTLDFSVPLTPSDRPDGFRLSLEGQLAKAAESPFGLERLDADPSLDGWFAPPSALKEARRAWYAKLEEAFAGLVTGCLADLVAEIAGGEPAQAASPPFATPVPPRSRLAPAGGLLFVTRLDGPDHDIPALWHDGEREWRVLPLPPACFGEAAFLAGLAEWMDGLPPGSGVLFGLNNFAHLDWLRTKVPAFGAVAAGWCRIGAFADYGLYVANPLAVALLREQVPGLLWFTPWVEATRVLAAAAREGGAGSGGGESDGTALPGQTNPAARQTAAGLPAAPDDPAFRPPLFISRVCFRRSSLGLGCPAGGPDACPKRFEYPLKQGERDFRVVVKDCLSYTFAD